VLPRHHGDVAHQPRANLERAEISELAHERRYTYGPLEGSLATMPT
jgi:hypothetical protein